MCCRSENRKRQKVRERGKNRGNVVGGRQGKGGQPKGRKRERRNKGRG